MSADNPKLGVRADGSGYMSQVPRLDNSPFIQSHGTVGQAIMARLQKNCKGTNLPLEQVIANYLQEM